MDFTARQFADYLAERGATAEIQPPGHHGGAAFVRGVYGDVRTATAFDSVDGPFLHAGCVASAAGETYPDTLEEIVAALQLPDPLGASPKEHS